MDPSWPEADARALEAWPDAMSKFVWSLLKPRKKMAEGSPLYAREISFSLLANQVLNDADPVMVKTFL